VPSSKVQPKRARTSKFLTDKERLFISAYWANERLDIAAAAKEAGYRGRNAGTQLMKKEKVLLAIGQELKKRLERGKLTQDDVLDHLKTILFLDPHQFFEENGSGMIRLRPLKAVPIQLRRCITKIKTKTTTSRNGNVTQELELELMSRDNALNLAMKHLGLIQPDNKTELNIKVGEGFLVDLLERVENADNVIDVDSKGA